jgi:serine kinase of HPr protein (carbohydrate metabolism regulator)
MTQFENIHATAVAFPDSGFGVLLRGPSGCGKSDLALRLIEDGAVLIADDRVDVTASNGRLLASPPAALAGLIEARGVGLVRTPFLSGVPVALAADLVAASAIERLPIPEITQLLSISLPLLRLDPWPASAALKLRLAVRQALLDK